MYGLDYVAFRYFNVYGPRMDIHGRYTEVLIRWMEHLEVGQLPIIFGDGEQTMETLLSKRKRSGSVPQSAFGLTVTRRSTTSQV